MRLLVFATMCLSIFHSGRSTYCKFESGPEQQIVWTECKPKTSQPPAALNIVVDYLDKDKIYRCLTLKNEYEGLAIKQCILTGEDLSVCQQYILMFPNAECNVTATSPSIEFSNNQSANDQRVQLPQLHPESYNDGSNRLASGTMSSSDPSAEPSTNSSSSETSSADSSSTDSSSSDASLTDSTSSDSSSSDSSSTDSSSTDSSSTDSSSSDSSSTDSSSTDASSAKTVPPSHSTSSPGTGSATTYKLASLTLSFSLIAFILS